MFCFFFSSRRRHTRFDCDWSSDVCSSDLRERQNVIGLRYRGIHSKIAVSRPVTGEPLACGAWSCRKDRELRGHLNGGRGPGLLQPSGCNFDGLVCVERLFFKGAQIVIVESAPPWALGEAVFRSAFAPRLGDIPFRWHGSRGALVFRPHRAAAEEGTNGKPGQGGGLPGAFHYCFLAPEAGFGRAAGWLGSLSSAISLTRTSWPSSRESAGFNTIQS